MNSGFWGGIDPTPSQERMCNLALAMPFFCGRADGRSASKRAAQYQVQGPASEWKTLIASNET